MNYWQETFAIGSLRVPRFIGGPLDGITDSPFRRLVREFSPHALQYTEMRHIASVANDHDGSRTLSFEQGELPLNYQISAAKLDYLDQGLEKIMARGVNAIDLNVGCPAKNVVGSGAGSALMNDVPRLKTIVSAIRAKTGTLPFTVKIRAGYKSVNAIEVAQMLEDCGVDAIAIHPRLQSQKFEGRPDYALAAAVKKSVHIPIIISGGVVNFKIAKMVYEQTGVDGYLIGRGIWGRPWKLKEMDEHSQGREYTVDIQTMIRCAITHLDYMFEYYGPRAVYAFRKHLPFYIRGVTDASAFRSELVRLESVADVRSQLQHLIAKV